MSRPAETSSELCVCLANHQEKYKLKRRNKTISSHPGYSFIVRPGCWKSILPFIEILLSPASRHVFTSLSFSWRFSFLVTGCVSRLCLCSGDGSALKGSTGSILYHCECVCADGNSSSTGASWPYRPPVTLQTESSRQQ